VPLSKDARAALDRLPTIGGYLFANVEGKAWSRWHARDLLERAEKLAELEPLEGSDFHAYRPEVGHGAEAPAGCRRHGGRRLA